MEPDGFDDVASRIVEVSEPAPRPPRRRRWALAATAAVVTVGGLAAGASALTGSGDHATRPAAPKAHAPAARTAEGIPVAPTGPECQAGKLHRHPASAPRS